MSTAAPISLYLPGYDKGGVERMMTNLARALAHHGVRVDLLLPPSASSYLEALPPGVSLHHLPDRGEENWLDDYCARHSPRLLLAAKPGGHLRLLKARQRLGLRVPVALRIGTTTSAVIERVRWPWRRRRLRAELRHWYPQADRLLAVSRSVADDLATLGIEAPVTVVPNPVIDSRLERLAAEPLPARPDDLPLIVAVGRLSRVKDFPTLLHAFARLRRRLPCRLAILGEGRQRPRLERLARRLRIAAWLEMPGHVANPYPWLAAADLFVLPSLFEGSPNALVEALALGTPSIASDAPGGAAGILGEGRYGPLFPVGDHRLLAECMERLLRHPPDPADLREAAAPFTVEWSSEAYLKALELD